MKALFIVNRRSGVRRGDVTAIIRQNCRDEFEVVECPPKENLDPIIERGRREHFDAIYAVGGDGTVHEVAKRLIGTPLALGIVPTGSGNGLARHLGFPMDALEAICAPHRIEIIDTATVNGIPFVGTMGVGFDAWVADAFASAGARGLATYLRVGIGGFFRYQSQPYQIEVDGERLERRALLIAVANASQYGNDARIAPVASLQDGLLDVVIVERASLTGAVRLFTGSLHRASGITMRRGRRIEIRRPAPGPAHLDGEPIALPETLTIEIVPRSLRVLVPESARAI
ncbi:MAG TPA: YegS/Rv2252/BmrU family lipid kinase [Thermoanaerobaculia bacterium]|nr:YegS/Rv2252/BmrU family lipid kinase [Thermoanaerobaculia bacterium]